MKTACTKAGEIPFFLFSMLPVSPVLLSPGFCPHLADFFFFPYFRLCRLPLQLFLMVIINIHCQAYQNHDADSHSPHIDAIREKVPYGKDHSHAK